MAGLLFGAALAWIIAIQREGKKKQEVESRLNELEKGFAALQQKYELSVAQGEKL